MGKIVAIALVLGFLVGGLCLLERRFHARPPLPMFTRSRLVDLAHWLVGTRICSATAALAFGVAMIVAFPAYVISRHGLVQPGREYVTPFMHLPVAIQMPLALVLGDFLGYWAHRFHHATPLWRFHAIHHSPRELDWFAGARNHPVAEAAGRIAVGIPLILLGVDLEVFGAIAPLIGLWGVFLHANVRWTLGPLRWVIATPLFHRWHHSRAPEARDKNFAGLFPIWDLLFGTLYLPDRQPESFGVDAEDIPAGFIGQLVHPFRTTATPLAERQGRAVRPAGARATA